MSTAAYEILNYMARFWFAGIALFLVLRIALASLRELRLAHRVRQEIDEAGAFATLVLMRPPRRGTLRLTSRRNAPISYPILQECLVGTGGDCDIRLRDKKLHKRHVRLLPEPERLRVIPQSGALVLLRGQEVQGEGVAVDGDELLVGGVRMHVRVGGAHGEREED